MDDWYRICGGGLGRGQGAVHAGHCLGDGEGGAQWGEGLHLGQIVGGIAVVELVRIGNMEELSELGKEIDGEAQQSCSLLLEGVKDTKEVDTIFHQVKMMDHMGFMGLQSLVVFDQQWTVEGEERNVLAAFGEIKEV